MLSQYYGLILFFFYQIVSIILLKQNRTCFLTQRTKEEEADTSNGINIIKSLPTNYEIGPYLLFKRILVHLVLVDHEKYLYIQIIGKHITLLFY